ncbi:hypothetical protein AGR1_21535 [Agrobacterium sp. B1(2019)]|nr:hypothetical protein AGR1_21535 [Agrobacterium sp. B1(2019)]
MWSPFVLSKQTESQMTDFTQLFFGQPLRPNNLFLALEMLHCVAKGLDFCAYFPSTTLAECILAV